jgi:hypothetical protein
MMLKSKLFTVFLLCSALGAMAQDNNESMESLLEQALVIKINARLISSGSKVSWNFSVARVTIPGRPVVLKLQGGNLQVKMSLTPYKEDDATNTIVLVTQGEVWITETPGKQAKYLASLKSVKVDLGEKIRLYPLGVSNTNSEKYNIELEIQVVPYKDEVKQKGSETQP